MSQYLLDRPATHNRTNRDCRLMREILRVSKICTNLDRSITCSWISTSERQLHILTSRLYRTSSITSTTSRWLSMQFSLSVEFLDLFSHLTLGALEQIQVNFLSHSL